MTDDDRPFVVIGSGGQARVVVSTCLAAGHVVKAVYDDDPQRWEKQLLGVPIVGAVDKIGDTDCRVIIGIGDARARSALARRWQFDWGSVVHPHAFVDPSVKLGAGSVVFAGAVIQPESEIGAHVIVNTSATVDHNCILSDYVQIAPGANLCGNVSIGAGTFVGAGAVVLENLMVGQWAIIGAGAVVIRPLVDQTVAVGCPARIIKRIELSDDSSQPRKQSAVRKVAQSVIHRIWQDSGRETRPISDHDTLTGTLKLDSLDLAVTVVGLEQELGVDPFRAGAAPVQTFGQLVTLYQDSCAQR